MKEHQNTRNTSCIWWSICPWSRTRARNSPAPTFSVLSAPVLIMRNSHGLHVNHPVVELNTGTISGTHNSSKYYQRLVSIPSPETQQILSSICPYEV
uniref:Uncharacterized protein n=1 Tax=Timema poppense TaxID=170557 RepID=A0A7R9CR19_TIMPO|nr:unnamed protein product [Timema poppensis]